mmetsp:Transcript_87633/g.194997  ORF Transcript_87633/g.194997 Transcript_87633/m.194997 type:complete len:233 (+) Transcript_87633:2829-3527(+)
MAPPQSAQADCRTFGAPPARPPERPSVSSHSWSDNSRPRRGWRCSPQRGRHRTRRFRSPRARSPCRATCYRRRRAAASTPEAHRHPPPLCCQYRRRRGVSAGPRSSGSVPRSRPARASSSATATTPSRRPLAIRMHPPIVDSGPPRWCARSSCQCGCRDRPSARETYLDPSRPLARDLRFDGCAASQLDRWTLPSRRQHRRQRRTATRTVPAPPEPPEECSPRIGSRLAACL